MYQSKPENVLSSPNVMTPKTTIITNKSKKYCLQWNNYHQNLQNIFNYYLKNELFADVTLSCEGEILHVHKLVLSACSSYFQWLFDETPCKHPVIILTDIRLSELKNVIEFMYKGVINIKEDQLEPVLKVAEFFKIRGLTTVVYDHDYCKPCGQAPLKSSLDSKDTIGNDTIIDYSMTTNNKKTRDNPKTIGNNQINNDNNNNNNPHPGRKTNLNKKLHNDYHNENVNHPDPNNINNCDNIKIISEYRTNHSPSPPSPPLSPPPSPTTTSIKNETTRTTPSTISQSSAEKLKMNSKSQASINHSNKLLKKRQKKLQDQIIFEHKYTKRKRTDSEDEKYAWKPVFRDLLPSEIPQPHQIHVDMICKPAVCNNCDINTEILPEMTETNIFHNSQNQGTVTKIIHLDADSVYNDDEDDDITPSNTNYREVLNLRVPSWSRSTLKEAIDAVITQKMRFSIAALHYNIPKGTLYDNVLGKSNRMRVLVECGLDKHDENAVLKFCCINSLSEQHRHTNKPLQEILDFVYTLKNTNRRRFEMEFKFGYRWWWAFCKKHNIAPFYERSSKKFTKIIPEVCSSSTME